MEHNYVSVESIRGDVAAQGGSSVFDGLTLLTIVGDEQKVYKVHIICGTWYAIVGE